MRVDVVAAPVRYPRAPLLWLLLIGIVPAVGLLALQRWADDEADRYEAASAEEEVSGPGEAPPPRPPGAAPLLTTSMLDYRRAPASVADTAGLNRLRSSMGPVFEFVGDRSCAAVSVGGRDAGSKNGDVPVIPASTQQLVVAAVALEALGPEYSFVTTVTAPPAVDGVIDGDLHLVGGGDPLLTTDDYPIEDDPYPATSTTSLDPLADAIAAQGITRINGAVVGDGTRYDDEWVVDAWADGVAFVDAGPYDALLVNDARVLFSSGTQSDPNSAGARELTRLLNERGVTVNRGWTSGEAPADLPVIASVESAPLTDVLAEMLTTSDNNTAEMLVKELGVADGAGGTRVAGLNVIDRTLRAWGIPVDGVRVLDGSGLHPENRLTCAALLAILQREAGGPIPTALPVAGQTGTLADEFTESPMSGRMRAQTGTLPNPPVEQDPPAVKALAGYVDVEPGDDIEFVLILNTPDIAIDRRFAPLWAALGERLAEHPSGPTAADLAPR